METDGHSNEDTPEKKEYGNILDFIDDPDNTGDLDLEVTITESGKVAVFHSKPFIHDLAWIEFDIDRRVLEFVLDDGQIRNIGVRVDKDIIKYIQNTHQILMILMDEDSGEAREGFYIPLLLHKM